MSEEKIPRCGKVIYPDASSAHVVMLSKKEACTYCKKEKLKLNYYYCELCEGYHLTRMTNNQQTHFIKMNKTAWYKRKKACEKNEVP